MAQDNSSNLSSSLNGDFDLEDLEVEVLIIAKNPPKMDPTVGFLKRRGWPTKVSSNISQALSSIVARPPDFVLISMNHPSPVIPMLPDILQTRFNLTCIAFCENMDNASAAHLQNYKITNKLTGPASGPAVHRFIRRLLAERLDLHEEERAAEEARVNGPPPMKESPHSGKAGRPRASSDADSEKEVLSTGTYTMAKRIKRSLKSVMGVPEDPLDSESSRKLIDDLKTNLFQGAPDASDVPEVTADDYPAEVHSDPTERYMSPEASAEVGQFAGQVEEVLSQTMNGETVTEAPTPLGYISRVGVFPVESATMPGYIVVATAMALRDRDEMLRRLEQNLRDGLKAQKFSGQIQEGFTINIPVVEFGPWVKDKATFALSFVHEGFDVSAAFFAHPGPLPKVREVGSNGMLAVDVDQITTQDPVTFKAYLYMKKNAKYFLYLRNGRRLQKEQKARLKDSNVKDLFMKNVDKENIRMFLAASFLRLLIEGEKDDDQAA